MFEIGPSLREARERRGLTTDDVQKAIRVRTRYLNALEEERWEQLPGDAYTKGFLRTYAEFLGLNGNVYVDEFNARHARHEDAPLVREALAPSRTPRVSLLRPLLVVVAVVAVGAAAAAWQLDRSPKEKAPPVPTPRSHPKAAATSQPTVDRVASSPVLPTRGELTASRGPVWLVVRAGDASGAVLFTGTLEQGKSLPLRLTRPVWVRVGAPWNLDVRVGGRLVHGLPAQVGNVVLTRRGLRPG